MSLQELFPLCDSMTHDTTFVIFETWIEYHMDSAPVDVAKFDDLPYDLVTADVRKFRVDSEEDRCYVWVEVEE